MSPAARLWTQYPAKETIFFSVFVQNCRLSVHSLTWPFSALTGPFLLIFGEVSGPGGGKWILVSKRVFSYVDFSNLDSASSRFGENWLTSHSHNFVHRCRSIARLYVFETCSTRSLQKTPLWWGIGQPGTRRGGGPKLWNFRNSIKWKLLTDDFSLEQWIWGRSQKRVPRAVFWLRNV